MCGLCLHGSSGRPVSGERDIPGEEGREGTAWPQVGGIGKGAQVEPIRAV